MAYVAAFLLLYVFEAANATFSIDEELAVYRDDARVWVAQGRWGIYLVERFLFPRPVTPVVPLALLGAGIAWSWIVLCDAVRIRNFRMRALGFAFVATYPSVFMLAEFATNAVPVAIGMVASSYCVILSREAGARRAAAFVAALAFAMSLYQSFLLFVLALGLLLLAHDRRADGLRTRSVAGRAARLGALAVAAALLYLTVSSAFQALLSAPSQYVGRFLDPAFVIAHPTDVGLRVLAGIARLYFGLWDRGFAHPNAALALATLVASGILVRDATRDPRTGAAATGALLAAAAVLPFALHATGAHGAPIRSVVAAPFVMCALFGFALAATRSGVARRLLIGAVAVAAFVNWSLLNQYFHAARSVAAHDSIVASNLFRDVRRVVPDALSEQPIPLVVVGTLPFENGYSFKDRVKSSPAGSSFFEWDGGNPDRIAAFLRFSGVGNFIRAPEDVRAALHPVAKSLPRWPADGSVAWIRGALVIRLRD